MIQRKRSANLENFSIVTSLARTGTALVIGSAHSVSARDGYVLYECSLVPNLSNFCIEPVRILGPKLAKADPVLSIDHDDDLIPANVNWWSV